MRINLAKTQKYRMYLGKCPYCGERLHLEQDINIMEPSGTGEEEVQSCKESANDE